MLRAQRCHSAVKHGRERGHSGEGGSRDRGAAAALHAQPHPHPGLSSRRNDQMRPPVPEPPLPDCPNPQRDPASLGGLDPRGCAVSLAAAGDKPTCSSLGLRGWDVTSTGPGREPHPGT